MMGLTAAAEREKLKETKREMRKGKQRDEKKKVGVKCKMKQSLCWVLVEASCGCGEYTWASVQSSGKQVMKDKYADPNP